MTNCSSYRISIFIEYNYPLIITLWELLPYTGKSSVIAVQNISFKSNICVSQFIFKLYAIISHYTYLFLEKRFLLLFPYFELHGHFIFWGFSWGGWGLSARLAGLGSV